ncbi:inorganic triphosphatase [Acinetobacter nectaris]|uniref:CYTH domain-containing protein n=1 Tax=Acinetobacter nectaris TaxID=1219382 RepID=UPI001F43AF10|nr:CYTH domain-containing protein [Acinetobacter nectaris]MCF8998886.1 CYTH domain-containing protein [Acinetobacter nectaris]MCF9027521.1 CYTH domain-containing protein [Acinetobacter nectaris]
MYEVELKLQIPQHKKLTVKKAIQMLSPEHTSLHAQYLDTENFLFAENFAALRLRKEDNDWVQTLKAGKNALARYENEINLGVSDTIPKVDLSLYKSDKTAQKILSTILKEAKAQPLQVKFETIVERDFKLVQHENTEVEICLDIGTVGNSKDVTQEIYELEFELKKGKTDELIHLVQDWVKKYHIWLDVRSKAERGNLLARNMTTNIAKNFEVTALEKKATGKQALQNIIASYTQQLLPNIAVISDQIADAKHFFSTQLIIENICHTLDLLIEYIPNTISENKQILLDLNNQLIDFTVLHYLKHETLQSVEAYQFKNIDRVLDKYRLEFSKTVRSPAFTCLILELMKLGLPLEKTKQKDESPRFEKILTKRYKLLKQQLAQTVQPENEECEPDAQTLMLISQFQYCLNHSHKNLLPLQVDKDYFSEVYDLYKNHLLSKQVVLQHVKAIKTEQFFFLGWISGREDKILKRYYKLMNKLSIEE